MTSMWVWQEEDGRGAWGRDEGVVSRAAWGTSRQQQGYLGLLPLPSSKSSGLRV